KWAACKLLDQQIARDLARCDMLAPGDVFDESRGFGGIELFETQCIEQFEFTLRIVRGFENLTPQSGEYKGKTATTKDTQDFRAQHNRAIQVLSELRAVEHHEGTAATGRNTLRRAEAKADQCFVVVTESQTVVRLDELLDPFEIGRQRQLLEILQS